MVSSKVRQGTTAASGNTAWLAAWLKAPGSPWQAMRFVIENSLTGAGASSHVLVFPAVRRRRDRLRRPVRAVLGWLGPQVNNRRFGRQKQTVENSGNGRKGGCGSVAVNTIYPPRRAIM